jgi:hypothetical protein
MGVKLWMRNFAQQNLNRFPPANGGYAGVRLTFKSCAPTRTLPAGEEPAHYRCSPVWEASPEERSDFTAQWYPNTKKAARKLQAAESFVRTDINRRKD